MSKNRMIMSAVVVVVVLGGLYVWKNPTTLSKIFGSGNPQSISDIKLAKPEAGEPPKDLAQKYESPTYPISFNYPSEYKANVIPAVEGEDGATSGETIVIDNGSGDGFQIYITPFDEPGSVLTEERIKQDVPDLVITDALTVELGTDGRGVAFKSNNENFDGASREVWFVYKGNLYQVSTYIRLDAMLQAVLGTFQLR